MGTFVHKKGSSKIQLTRSIHKIEELGPILHQAITRQKMPKAIDTLKSGSTVSFGPFALSNQGLTMKNKLIPWNEIKSVRVNNGAIMVDRSGKITWSGIAASSIPNLYLFLTLVDQIVGVNRR